MAQTKEQLAQQLQENQDEYNKMLGQLRKELKELKSKHRVQAKAYSEVVKHEGELLKQVAAAKEGFTVLKDIGGRDFTGMSDRAFPGLAFGFRNMCKTAADNMEAAGYE